MTKKHIARPASAREIEASLDLTNEDRRVVKEVLAKTGRKTKETVVVPEIVDFLEVFSEILVQVADDNDLNAWKAAFPEIEFAEVDEGFSGRPIGWEERSTVEKAVYVAYMNDPQMASVDYEIDADGYKVRVSLDDSERVWWLWMAGGFVALDEVGVLSLNAKETLLRYAAQRAGEFEEMVMDSVDVGDVSLLSMELKVRAF